LVVSEGRPSHVYYRLADPQIRELLAVARALLLAMQSEDSARLDAAQSLPEIGGEGRRPSRALILPPRRPLGGPPRPCPSACAGPWCARAVCGPPARTTACCRGPGARTSSPA